MSSRRRKGPWRTPYRMGARFEQTVKHALERTGWRTMRSAGSHDPIDILAWRAELSITPSGYAGPPKRRVVALQCKRDGRIDPKERNDVLAFCAGLTPEAYVVRSQRRQLQVRDLARWSTETWVDLREVL